MNNEATIDNMLKSISKPAEYPTITFTDEEIGDTDKNTHKLVRRRIITLMERKTLTALDVNLLDVLLKHEMG